MAYGAQLAERDGRGDIDGAQRRERRYWTPWLAAVVLGGLAIGAVCVVVSAVTVVSRLPFGDTGVILPTVPLTTSTTPTPPPSAAAPLPAPAIQAPSAAPPSAPPPPPTTAATHPSTSRSEPSSVHPSTHRPFPQETTDFPGPPGTNN
jgi:hypothetical protein